MAAGRPMATTLIVPEMGGSDLVRARHGLRLEDLLRRLME